MNGLTALALILLTLSEIAAFLPTHFQYQITFAEQFGYILLILLIFTIFYASTVLKFRVFLLLGIAFAAGAFSELLGTTYGWIYGQRYYYTASFLGYKVLGRVPFSILLLWTIIIMLAYSITNIIDPANFFSLKKTLNIRSFAYVLLLSTLDGFLAMNLDLVLDPIYVGFGAWVWPEGGAYFGVPISNFLGWFFVAFTATLVFRIYSLNRPYKIEVDVYYLAPVIAYATMGIVKYGVVSRVIGHVEYAIIGISVMFPFIAIATLSYRLKKYKADLSSVTRGVASCSRPCDTEEVDG